jgi:Domain of unknown function (DUF1854)
VSQDKLDDNTGKPSATRLNLTPDFDLRREPSGLLVLVDGQSQEHVDVHAVRAFPLQLQAQAIAIVSAHGKELAWVDVLADVSPGLAELIRASLGEREFMPVLQSILKVSSYSTPSTWSVITDRGPTEFVLRGDEDIRRVGKASDQSESSAARLRNAAGLTSSANAASSANALMIADVHGIHYYIPDRNLLDAHSRKILDRFK